MYVCIHIHRERGRERETRSVVAEAEDVRRLYIQTRTYIYTHMWRMLRVRLPLVLGVRRAAQHWSIGSVNAPVPALPAMETG